MPAHYAHIDFAPTPAVRESARRALADGAASLSPVAAARVRAVAAGRRLAPAVVRRMATGAEGDALTAWATRLAAAMDGADRVAEKSAAPVGADPGLAVVLPIDAETAEFAFGDAASEAHVTLAYLGRCSALPFGAVDLARMTVAQWASQTPALPALFSGVGRFHGDDGEGDAVYLSVDAPGLSAARDTLCRMLRAAGLPVAATHGFTPHATLAYLPREAATPDAPCDLPLALRLDCAAVWCGADHGTPAPLTGNGDPAMMADTDDGVTMLCPEATPIVFTDGAQPAVGHSTWNQIARVGRFLGHPQGAVEFTPQVFDEIIANHAAHGNAEIPLDYEHTSERLPDSAATTGVPAPGWVKKVEKRDGGKTLWALIKWASAAAVNYVRTEQYKYVSPAVNFRSRDKASGKPAGARLTSVALTNHPFLEGMAPLAADDRSDALDALLAQVAGRLGLDAAEVRAKLLPSGEADEAEGGTIEPPTTETPPMNEEEMKAAEAARMAATTGAPMVAADLPKMAPDAPPAGAAVDPAKEKDEKAAADAEGVKRDGVGKFASMLASAATACGMTGFDPAAEGAEDSLIAQIGGMAAELARHQQAEKAAMQASAAAMSDRAIAAKLAPATARDSLAALCLSDRATFDALYPEAAMVAAEGSRTFSDRGGPSLDGAAILSQRVGLAGGTTHRTAAQDASGESATFTSRVDTRARAIAAEKKVDLITATHIADAELRAAPAH